jgi:hypothetical protein
LIAPDQAGGIYQRCGDRRVLARNRNCARRIFHTNVESLLDPELLEAFPDSKSVNDAPRALLTIATLAETSTAATSAPPPGGGRCNSAGVPARDEIAARNL